MYGTESICLLVCFFLFWMLCNIIDVAVVLMSLSCYQAKTHMDHCRSVIPYSEVSSGWIIFIISFYNMHAMEGIRFEPCLSLGSSMIFTTCLHPCFVCFTRKRSNENFGSASWTWILCLIGDLIRISNGLRSWHGISIGIGMRVNGTEWIQPYHIPLVKGKEWLSLLLMVLGNYRKGFKLK